MECNYNTPNYTNYITSDAWKKKKKQYFSSKMFKHLKIPGGGWGCYCCKCNDKPLEVHHKTYKRFGNENISIDLVAVCHECHMEIHKLAKSGVPIFFAIKKVKNRKNRK